MQENEMYARQVLLTEIGVAGQAKLSKARVLVIGAGGLGCPVLQYLAGAGVGTIGIVDGDVVSVTNLHRQILYGVADVGKPKALVAANRLRQLNPYITVNVHNEFLSTNNAMVLFKQYDIIVDGSDNFATRYLINDAAVLTGKPVVMGAIFKFEGQLTVYNYQNGPTYRCLYAEAPEEGSVPNCSEIGVVGVLPGMVGCMQANEVIKMIIGYGKVLSGRLLVFDAKTYEYHCLQYKKQKETEVKELLADDAIACGVVPEIELAAVLDHNYSLLDVRTLEEYKHFHLDAQHIPLQELERRYSELQPAEEMVVYCQSGKRSKLAIKLLQEKFPETTWWSLKNGLQHR
ncbi:molybdopterin-synthase adenylyltransferase MoeB [Zhouia sp. PK063]|uniref:molybdopterin-synthase adenylyltransferase MoeB n=1 Tax=Zhouia sp. PK063 TaxID=3373602 RepID=UPI0037BCCB86